MNKKLVVQQARPSYGSRWFVSSTACGDSKYLNRAGVLTEWSSSTCLFHSKEEAQKVLDKYMENQKPADFYKIEKIPAGTYTVKIGDQYLYPDGEVGFGVFQYSQQADIFLALAEYCKKQKFIQSDVLYSKIGKMPCGPIVFECSDQNFTFDEIIYDKVKARSIIKLKPAHLDG